MIKNNYMVVSTHIEDDKFHTNKTYNCSPKQVKTLVKRLNKAFEKANTRSSIFVYKGAQKLYAIERYPQGKLDLK